MNIIVYLTSLKATTDDDIVNGNVSSGLTQDGNGQMKGQKLIKDNATKVNENKKILEDAMAKRYGNFDLNGADKNKVQSIIDKAAHGNVNTLNNLVSRGVINQEQLAQLTKNAHGITPLYKPHYHSPQLKKDDENVDHFTPVETEKPTNTKDHYEPIDTNTHDDLVAKEPSSSATMKLKPNTPVKLDEQRQHKLEQEAHDKESTKKHMGEYAYDKSIKDGLTHEEAEANQEAAHLYYDYYQNFLDEGYSLPEADSKARKLVFDPMAVAPNGKHAYDLNKADHTINKTKGDAQEGMLSNSYSSKYLVNEAAEALKKEAMSYKNHKETGKMLTKALKEDRDKLQKIKDTEQRVKEDLEKIKKLKDETIKGRAESGNTKPGELEDPDFKEEVTEKMGHYKELTSKIHEVIKKATSEDLLRQKNLDDDLMKKLTEQVQEQKTEIQEEKVEKHDKITKNEEEYNKKMTEEEKKENNRPQTTFGDEAEKVMQETEEQRAHEEALTQQYVDQIVQHAGEQAYDNVKEMGGTDEEAENAKSEAKELKQGQIDKKIEEVFETIVTTLEDKMDPETAKETAYHTGFTHVLGKWLKKSAEKARKLMDPISEPVTVTKKRDEKDEESSQIADPTLTTEETVEHVTTEHVNKFIKNQANKPEIKGIIPDTAKEFPVKDVKLHLPLPVEEETIIETLEEEQYEEMKNENKGEYRNATYAIKPEEKAPVTGLITLHGEGEDTVLSEAVKEIAVDKGVIQITEEEYGRLKKQGHDVTPYKKKVDPVKDTVYELPINNSVLGLGTDGNRDHPVIKMNEETIPLGGVAAEVIIEEGEVISDELADFRKFMRPDIHKGAKPADEQEQDPVEMNIINDFLQEEKRRKMNKDAVFNIYKDDKTGETVTKRQNLYGVDQVVTLDEAKAKASGPEEPVQDNVKDEPIIHLDMDENSPKQEDGVETFINQTETQMHHPEEKPNKPFVITDKPEEPTLDNHSMITTTEEVTYADGSPLKPEDMDELETQEHEQLQKIANEETETRTTTTTTMHITAPGDATDGVKPTSTIPIETKSSNTPEHKAETPKADFNKAPSNATPLQPTNPVNDEPFTEGENITHYTETVTNYVQSALLPEDSPDNKVINTIVKNAPSLADQLQTNVETVVETITHVVNNEIHDLIEAIKHNDPPSKTHEILNKMNKAMPKAPLQKPGDYHPLVKTITNVVSHVLAKPNVSAPIVSKVPVGQTVEGLGPNGQPMTYHGVPGTSQVIKREQINKDDISFDKHFTSADMPHLTGSNYIAEGPIAQSPATTASYPQAVSGIPQANPNLNGNGSSSLNNNGMNNNGNTTGNNNGNVLDQNTSGNSVDSGINGNTAGNNNGNVTGTNNNGVSTGNNTMNGNTASNNTAGGNRVDNNGNVMNGNNIINGNSAVNNLIYNPETNTYTNRLPAGNNGLIISKVPLDSFMSKNETIFNNQVPV